MSETDSEASVDANTQPAAADVAPAAQGRQPASFWRGQIAASKRQVDDRLQDWQTNVNFRVQKPFGGVGDNESSAADRVAVPEDWARTRQKTAQLSFQLPKIIADPTAPQFEPAAPLVSAAVNKILDSESRASYMIDECLADVINAAGLMVSKVGIDIRYEEVQEPNPPTLEQIPLEEGGGVREVPPAQPFTVVRHKISQRIYWDRLSPADFLWPAEFKSSDWDKAAWLGHKGRLPVPEARRRWKLAPTWEPPKAARHKSLADNVLPTESLVSDEVEYTEIWYYAALIDGDKVHPDCIRTIIFVEGQDQPVVHEDTPWQQWVPSPPVPAPAPAAAPPAVPPAPGAPVAAAPPPPPPPSLPHYVGLRKLPIRVATLQYISDMAVPPSDSEAARPQVREMIRSRSQMIRQRDHSVPLRWFDVNRIDDDVIQKMRAGEWQDMIPLNGGGERAIGEIARANYPRENFEFQHVIGADLDRAWSLGSNQFGAVNNTIRSAAEVKAIGGANDVRLEYEKARVNRYIAEGASIIFSLLQRYLDQTMWVKIVGEQGIERLTPVTDQTLSGDYDFTFKADSSDRVDVGARLDRAIKTYNLMAKSPTCNASAWEKEILELSGFDPAKFLRPPQQKGPDNANISFRFSGEDMLNPMAVAAMLKSGYDIGPDDIKAAAMMIRDAIASMPNAMAMGAPPTVGQTTGQPNTPAPQSHQDMEAPPTAEPILKRAGDGSRLVA
jgi:hypothetical protein